MDRNLTNNSLSIGAIQFFLLLLSLAGCKNSYQRAFEEITADPYRLVLEPSWEEVALLSKAIKYKPEAAFIYYNRAEQYQLLKEYQKAINDYKTCAQLDWEFGQLYFELGKCELQLNKNDEALTDLIIAQALFEQEWKDMSDPMKEPNHWGDPAAEHRELMKKIQQKVKMARKAQNEMKDN